MRVGYRYVRPGTDGQFAECVNPVWPYNFACIKGLWHEIAVAVDDKSKI